MMQNIYLSETSLVCLFSFTSPNVSLIHPIVRYTVLGQHLHDGKHLKRMSNATSISFELQVQRESREELPGNRSTDSC